MPSQVTRTCISPSSRRHSNSFDTHPIHIGTLLVRNRVYTSDIASVSVLIVCDVLVALAAFVILAAFVALAAFVGVAVISDHITEARGDGEVRGDGRVRRNGEHRHACEQRTGRVARNQTPLFQERSLPIERPFTVGARPSGHPPVRMY